MREDALSFVMLFCALLLVRNATASWEQLPELVPLRGQAKRLVEQLSVMN